MPAKKRASKGAAKKFTAAASKNKRRKVDEVEELVCEEPTFLSEQARFRYLAARCVKIFVTAAKPHYSMPWQMKRQTKSTSTGFVISNRRIVTNAHCVTYQSSVQVRRQGSADKVVARVVHVGHDCDLALLTVDDEDFWTGLDSTPLELGGLPELQTHVTVVGYPTGGENISITAGVVSRLDMQQYSHSESNLLAVQIDAAINSGNSGGPAFHNGKVIGIAFESLVDAENIGYIIPIPVLEHYLQDVEHDSREENYRGFGVTGFHWQTLENVHLRASLGVQKNVTGVVITKLNPLTHAAKALHVSDVIVEIDGAKIADDGTVAFRNDERIGAGHIVTKKWVGDFIEFKVLRKGKQKMVKLKVEKHDPLVKAQLYDQLPSYYVHAGLVFTVLSEPYMYAEWGKDWEWKGPVRLVQQCLYGVKKEAADEQVVILGQVLSHAVNVGYDPHQFAPQQVIKVNGTKIVNLAQLVKLVQSNRAKYVRFDLQSEKFVILPTKEAKAATSEVLATHNISNAMSPDLR